MELLFQKIRDRLHKATAAAELSLIVKPYCGIPIAGDLIGRRVLSSLNLCLMLSGGKPRTVSKYTFPPSSVGEVERVGAPSRREIGHGMLAGRALGPMLPSEDDFPYTICVESTITEGVPVKCSIAGIAIGLVLDTKEFGGDGTPLILSDITGGCRKW